MFDLIFSSVYAPRQKFWFGSVPWICPSEYFTPVLFHCEGVHTGPFYFDSFEDTGYAFGRAADQCPDTSAIPAGDEIPFLSCREADESPTIIGMQYWMHNAKPLFSFSAECSEIRVRWLFVWLMKLVLGYECGPCPKNLLTDNEGFD